MGLGGRIPSSGTQSRFQDYLEEKAKRREALSVPQAKGPRGDNRVKGGPVNEKSRGSGGREVGRKE